MLEVLQVLRRTEWLHKHLQSRRIVRCHSFLSDIPAEDLAGRVVQRAFCKGKYLNRIRRCRQVLSKTVLSKTAKQEKPPLVMSLRQ